MPRTSRASKKIVFFFPSFASSEATASLGVLAVATPLIRAGYQIVLIDSTISPNYKKRVLEEIRDSICLGISLVTGPMIRETVEIARAVKEWDQDLAQKALSLSARWILNYDVYKYPVEIWLNNKLKKRTATSKPAVDAKRLANTTAEAAC